MTQPETFTQAKREHTSLLAAVEKRVLIWVAERLPGWVNSDHLTALGFAAILATGVFYWQARGNRMAVVGALLCLALNWFGDSLDGTLARVRNRQRPRYGFYVDHILDAVGMAALMAGLALSGFMRPSVAGAFLVAYLLLSIEIYLATYTIGTFHLSFWSFGPTELRILLAIGSLVVLLHSPYAIIAGRSFLLFDVGFGIGTVGLLAVLAQAMFKHTRALYELETQKA